MVLKIPSAWPWAVNRQNTNKKNSDALIIIDPLIILILIPPLRHKVGLYSSRGDNRYGSKQEPSFIRMVLDEYFSISGLCVTMMIV